MKRLKKTIVFLACCYLALTALSVAIFHLPWRILELYPEAKRDELISSGIVSANIHPLYRDWLKSFVRTPNAPRDPHYTMDTYRAYGRTVQTSVDDDPSDFLGFANTISPHEAQVLFVGDSFCNGASVGTKFAPPAVYAKLTGAKVYNASLGGYGLGQYVRIIDRLTNGLPPNERFVGKDVVVQVYLGNDFTGDIRVYKIRMLYSEHALAWQLSLGPLRAWVKYLLVSTGVRPAYAGMPFTYYPVPMQCQTPGELPFAWHPGLAAFLFRDNFTEQLPMIHQFVDQLRALAVQGRSIKIVLIPSSLQVVFNDIDWSKIDSTSHLPQELPQIVAMLNEVRSFATDIFHKAGFEVLDMTDILRSSPQRCLYYQPADTHCTALGYEAIGRAIAARWPDLGRAQPAAPAATGDIPKKE
jgi:hypothetical protein